MFNKIRTAIDPFYVKVDDENNIRVSGDINEEEDDPLPWGEFGPYCPVTMVKDNWLVPGKPDKELFV